MRTFTFRLAVVRQAALVMAWVAAAFLALPGTGTGGEAWPTAGGDGGRIVEVTTLADQGPGSLRAALAQNGRRQIVFQIAGEIILAKPLLVANPFVTIAGETAQSPGITILGDKIRIRTHDVVLRHIRIRVGETGSSKASNRDGISVEGRGDDDEPVSRILIEHCSIAWAVDENLSLWGEGVRDVVVRRTIIAEALRNSVHPKGEHAMGMMIGPGVTNVLVEGNLLAHNAWRNPVVHGGASAVILNNLIYDPRFAGLHFYRHEGSGGTTVAAVGNVVIAGPDTRANLPAFSKGINPNSRIFYEDNSASGTIAFDAQETLPGGESEPAPMVERAPIWFDGLTVLNASAVEEAVLRDVGSRPWDRDHTDRRIVEEVAKRKGGLRDRPDDLRLTAERPLRWPELDAAEREPGN